MLLLSPTTVSSTSGSLNHLLSAFLYLTTSLVPRPHHSARPLRFRSRGPFVSDTSPKCIDREDLGRRRTANRKTLPPINLLPTATACTYYINPQSADRDFKVLVHWQIQFLPHKNSRSRYLLALKYICSIDLTTFRSYIPADQPSS